MKIIVSAGGTGGHIYPALAIINKFKGGPVGLDTLAASIGEDRNTIEDVYEPYLLQLGFINRSPRGRIAMPNAYKHLNINYPQK